MPSVKQTKSGMFLTPFSEMIPCQIPRMVAFTLLYIDSLRNRKCNRIIMDSRQTAARQEKCCEKVMEAMMSAVKNKIKETNMQLAASKGFDKLKNGASQLGATIKGSVSKSVDGLSKKIDGVAKSVNGVAKKIVKWGLALFGIIVRSAEKTHYQH